MKRQARLFVLVSVSISLIFFTSCAKKETPPPEQPHSSGPAKVTAVADPGGTGMGMQYAMELFNQRNPDVRVEFLSFPFNQLAQKYMLDHQGKTGAYDVVNVQAVWMSDLASAGYLEPLDDYVTRAGINMKEYYPGALSGSYYKDKLYGMPYMPNIWVLFCRKDIFESKGLAYPTNFDEYLACAQKLMLDEDGDGNTDIYATAFMGSRVSVNFSFNHYMSAYGAQAKNFWFDEAWNPVVDNPNAVAALTRMVEISKFAPPGVSNFEWQDGFTNFAQGRLAMVEMPSDLVGLWEDPAQSKVVGKVTGMTITQPGNPGYDMTSPWTLCIPKWSKHKEEAFKYVAFATGREMDKALFLKFGCPPSLPDTFSDPEVLAKYPYFDKLLDHFRNALPTMMAPGVTECQEALNGELNAAIAGIKTPEQALKDAAKAMRQVMEDYGYYEKK